MTPRAYSRLLRDLAESQAAQLHALKQAEIQMRKAAQLMLKVERLQSRLERAR